MTVFHLQGLYVIVLNGYGHQWWVERIWKEMVVAYMKVLFHHLPREMDQDGW